MVHFPKEVFGTILDYCDDRVEKKQRYLWSCIEPCREVSVGEHGMFNNIQIYCMSNDLWCDASVCSKIVYYQERRDAADHFLYTILHSSYQ